MLGNNTYAGRMLWNDQISYLEGRLLTHIESLGMPEKQENAFKAVFRDIFYETAFNQSTAVTEEQILRSQKENRPVQAGSTSTLTYTGSEGLQEVK